MRFAQILYNKAHWILEAEVQPQFAPNIVLIDITDKPEVQEGWDYDEVTRTFSEPIPIEPKPQPPSETDILAEELVKMKFENMQKDAVISTFGEEITKLKLEMMILKGGA